MKEEFCLVDKGLARCSLVIGREAPKPVTFAAQELQHYVERMSLARLPIRWDDEDPVGQPVLLGSPEDNKEVAALQNRLEIPEGETDAFVIATVGEALVLSGSNPRSTLYAVYELLERFGCRWLAPGEDDVPFRETLSILPGVDRVTTPLSFRMFDEEHGRTWHRHHFRASPHFFIDWLGKLRVNVMFLNMSIINGSRAKLTTEDIEDFALRGIEIATGGHLVNRVLPIADYYQEHPDWYALRNGKRITPKDHVRLCHANMEAINAFTDNLIAFLRKHPFISRVAIYENDGLGDWCECEDCRAIEPDPDRIDPSYNVPVRTSTYMRWVKLVEERLHRELPHVRLTFGPYYEMTLPPVAPDCMPSKRCTCMLDAYSQCMRHPLDAPCQKEEARVVADWQPIYPLNNFTWLYHPGDHVKNVDAPLGYVRKLVAEMRYCCRVGVHGYGELICEDDPTSLVELNALNLYALGKASWNPDLDPDELIREYCARAYGSAVAPMSSFYLLLEDMMERYGEGEFVLEDGGEVPEKWMHPFGIRGNVLCVFPNERVLSRLAALLDEAISLAEGRGAKHIHYIRRNLSCWQLIWQARKADPGKQLEIVRRVRRLMNYDYWSPRITEDISGSGLLRLLNSIEEDARKVLGLQSDQVVK